MRMSVLQAALGVPALCTSNLLTFMLPEALRYSEATPFRHLVVWSKTERWERSHGITRWLRPTVARGNCDIMDALVPLFECHGN